jgi:hypothetical protein
VKRCFVEFGEFVLAVPLPDLSWRTTAWLEVEGIDKKIKGTKTITFYDDGI